MYEDQAPVEGEDFQIIADDYQRLIEPGKYKDITIETSSADSCSLQV